ncbi:unannotated protein [freshwater metagenome]|uniref:Unannotated protein n=1 Tax=freshwater metagenome TaxID=449393 RepID=A0A6J7EWV1_9ZZZZ|nr:hypothetical protein [Actinomycetota bacterium]MSX70728.1 hypothetical protein [Actinomycetota bacterium]
MRKIFTSVTVLIFLGLSFSAPARAAVKAGTTCTSKGQIKVSQNKKFTCIKSGKKLVWKAQASEPAAPTSFDNLLANYKGIPAAAWRSTQANIAANTLPTPPLEVVLGPNTKMPYNKSVSERALRKVTGIFKNFAQPPRQTSVFNNFTDLIWAKEYLAKFTNPFIVTNTYADQAVEHCPSEFLCRGAFGNYAEGTGLIINSVSLPDDVYIIPFAVNGAVDIHEFTHTIQKAQFLEMNKTRHWGHPHWFSEGQPQVAGFTGASNTLAEYKEMRTKTMDAPAKGLGGYSPADISRFYVLQSATGPEPATKELVYTIGYITVEALVALKGIDSTMNLVKAVASGDTFEQAFKKIYGIEWIEAEPILAEVVSKQFLEVRKFATSNG